MMVVGLPITLYRQSCQITLRCCIQKIWYKVGQAVRQTIKKIGGTMPEDLPTPVKSAKQIEKEKKEELIFRGRKKIES